LFFFCIGLIEAFLLNHVASVTTLAPVWFITVYAISISMQTSRGWLVTWQLLLCWH